MSKFTDFKHKVSLRLNSYQFDFLCDMAKKYDIGISDSIRLILDSYIPQHGIGDFKNADKGSY